MISSHLSTLGQSFNNFKSLFTNWFWKRNISQGVRYTLSFITQHVSKHFLHCIIVLVFWMCQYPSERYDRVGVCTCGVRVRTTKLIIKNNLWKSSRRCLCVSLNEVSISVLNCGLLELTTIDITIVQITNRTRELSDLCWRYRLPLPPIPTGGNTYHFQHSLPTQVRIRPGIVNPALYQNRLNDIQQWLYHRHNPLLPKWWCYRGRYLQLFWDTLRSHQDYCRNDSSTCHWNLYYWSLVAITDSIWCRSLLYQQWTGHLNPTHG